MTSHTAGGGGGRAPLPGPTLDERLHVAELERGGHAGWSGVPTTSDTGSASTGTSARYRPEAARRRARVLRRKWSALRVAGTVVMGIWFLGLVVFSTALYRHHFLGEDFATYNQAWSLIGTGHLDPFDTVYGFPFVKADFELILWPLALLHTVLPSPLTLLWIQDAAVAGTGLVVYRWIVDYLEEKALRWAIAAGVAAVVLAVIVVDPAAYQTLLFDFHMEPLTALFLVLAGRDLWRGRTRRAWVWVALTLLCGSFAAVTLIGLGISAVLAGRATRRQGLAIVLVAVAWSVLISVIRANQGSGIDFNYAYLAGRSTLPGSSGLAPIALGIVTHPSRLFDQLHHRLGAVYTLMKPVGVVGLASAWGFGVPFVVLTANALNSNSIFTFEAFQSAAAFPFLLLGTVMVLLWLAQRFRYGWVPSLLIASLLTVQALAYGITTSPGNVRWAVDAVPSGAAKQLDLALARTPPQAEVVATEAVMGRFSTRAVVCILVPGGTYPIMQRPVVFVIDTAGHVRASTDDRYITFLGDQLHARVLAHGGGVWAFEWQPPKGMTHFVMPRPPHRAASP